MSSIRGTPQRHSLLIDGSFRPLFLVFVVRTANPKKIIRHIPFPPTLDISHQTQPALLTLPHVFVTGRSRIQQAGGGSCYPQF